MITGLPRQEGPIRCGDGGSDEERRHGCALLPTGAGLCLRRMGCGTGGMGDLLPSIGGTYDTGLRTQGV